MIILDIIVILLDTGILVWAQINLNRFWRTTKDIFATNTRIGVGEVLLALFGILIWIGALLPESYLSV